MIIREFYRTRTDGVNLYKTFSDLGYKIHKIGTDEVYDEAIDVDYLLFEYEEINEININEESGQD